MKKLLLYFITLIFFISKENAQNTIKMEDIDKHVGDSVKICTKIYSARYLPRAEGSPTFLDAGEIYPNNPLIILIQNKDRENFEDQPEIKYVYKNVCIIGKVDLDNGKPRIIVTFPEQITIQ
jgi:hypothetical protein